MKVNWHAIVLLTFLATGLQIFLGILSRAAGGLFVPGSPTVGGIALQILFICCMPVVDVLSGVVYALFHRRASSLTPTVGALGGAIISCLARLLSTLFTSVIDFFIVLITPPESILGMGPEATTSEAFAMNLVGRVAMIVILPFLGILLGGIGGAIAVVAMTRLPSFKKSQSVAGLAPAETANGEVEPKAKSHAATNENFQVHLSANGRSWNDPDASWKQQLNPFAFPAETQLRIVLLIVAIVAINWIYGTVLMYLLLVGPYRLATVDMMRTPVVDLLEVHSGEPDSFMSINPFRREQLINEHIAALKEDPEARQQIRDALLQLGDVHLSDLSIGWPYVALPTLFSLSIIAFWTMLYLTHAARLRRFGGARALSQGDQPALQDAVTRLVKDVQDRQRNFGDHNPPDPQLRVSRGMRGEGQTYGFPGRYAIVLSRSLSVILRKDLRTHRRPYRVRALVLHELAHIVNRDVGLAYWAEASWSIVLALTLVLILLLPWPLSSVESDTLQAVRLLPWGQMLITLLMIELNRRSLLRSREHYADLRTALFWGAEEPLLSVLAKNLAVTRRHSEFHNSIWSRLKDWVGWSKHPSGPQRRDRIVRSDVLFRVRDGLALQAGMLFSYVLLVAGVFATLLLKMMHASVSLMIIHGTLDLMDLTDAATAMSVYHRLAMAPQSIFIIVIGVLVIGVSTYLLAGTVGVQIQHETLWQMIRRKRGWRSYLGLLRPALLVTVGLEVGLLLIPFTSFFPKRPIGVFAIVLWMGFATLPIWLWMAATRFCARRLLGSHVGDRPPNGKRRLLTFVSTVPLSLALVSVVALQMWFWLESPSEVLQSSWSPFVLSALGLVMFGITLVLMFFVLGVQQALQRKRPRRCPACGQRTVKPLVITESCEHCGHSLAPWLFVPQGSDQEDVTTPVDSDS